MQFLAQNWSWLLGIFTVIGVFGGAIYKFSIRDSVSKHELYKKDGQPIYRHVATCRNTVQEICGSIGDMKDTVEVLAKDIQQDRVTTFSFMSAVKEKLDLKFTLPKS